MANIIESLLCFFDVETTGVVPGLDEVCEIAAIMTDLDLNEMDRIEMKVQLSDPELMTPEAARINGYDSAVWAEEAKPFGQWKAWLKKLCPRPHIAIPVGHNVGFDHEIILQAYYKPYREFFHLAFRKIDTVGISMLLKQAGIIDVQDVKLETVRKALKIGGEHHRAMGDAEAVKKIYEMSLELIRLGSKRMVFPTVTLDASKDEDMPAEIPPTGDDSFL